MKRFAVIGENKNDTMPMCVVWNKLFSKKAHFKVILPGIEGDQLEKIKFFKDLRAEIKANAFDGVIAIRDLDGLRSEIHKLEKRNRWFEKVTECGTKAFMLLNIYELEALHFADISVFNKRFKTKVSSKRTPEFIKEPKEELKKESTKHGKVQFKESHNKEMIPKLDFSLVENRCKFYKDFMADLKQEFGL